MKTNLWLMILIGSLLAAQAVSPLAVRAAEPALLFSDDFNGSALDTNKWVPTYWWGTKGCTIATNGELEWYLPDDVSVSDGALTLTAEKRTVTGGDGKSYEYTSGVVTTGKGCWQDSAPDKFVFQYGYVEMRARVPNGRGLWPAFWLLSGDQDWPPEIDALEILGHQPTIAYMTVHFEDTEGVHRSSGGQWTGPDFSAGWHTFGVDWQPTAIIWYIDGVERRRYTDSDRIPAEPMYLLLNLAVGGTWPGAPDSSTVFPASYKVDYVRVWSSRPQTGP